MASVLPPLLGCLLLAPLAAAAADSITITGRAPLSAGVAGFGNLPLAEAPLSALVYGNEQLADRNVQSVSGLTLLDASIGDAYDAPGYWTIIQIRGYTLDNRSNYRRDGLPINAETAIALDNKERLEVLKGTSGIQAGSSAPGGLVNLVVKRPRPTAQRSATLQVEQHGSVLAAADIGDRAGTDGRVGWRVNVAAQRLDPRVRDSAGQRWLAALAADWQLGPGTLLEAEVESSRQKQPSLAGYSLLGDRVPDPRRDVDVQRNLNHQPWGQPVVLAGTTASLRWQQRLADDWRLVTQAMTQRLKSDDRTAFPYGVYDPATYACTDACDRFATDGTFTYWQFVSDNERRTTDALQAAAIGRARTGPVTHAIEAGVLGSRFRGRFQDQIFDIAGTGNVDGSLQTPPSPGTTSPGADRDERNLELFARDAMRWGADSLWAGVRRTHLRRQSTDTDYKRDATIPFVALARQLTPQTMLYASWGRGLETDVAPSLGIYANAGQPLPALKSRQREAGVRHAGEQLDAALTLFAIERPVAGDIGDCGGVGSCVRAIDGSARHRGVETQLGWHAGPWLLQASAMLLDAERRGSANGGVNGARPVNVPVRTLRASAAWRVAALPGLELQAAFRAEGDRVVLPYDSSIRIGGWAAWDLGARWQQAVADGTALTWRVGVDNAADRRVWKESPYQFGHAYLYPLAPRTWRASLQVAF